jgi:hypothetical protein
VTRGELNRMTGYALASLSTTAAGELDDPRINLRSPLLTGTATLDDELRAAPSALASPNRYDVPVIERSWP